MDPSHDIQPGIREIFLDIAASCDRLESPVYADLARCVADWCDEEPLVSLLMPYVDARVEDMVPLRLLSAVHRLALAREASEVAIFLPTTGGMPPRDEADRERLRRAFLAAIDSHRGYVAEALARVPQTNEVGRVVGLAALLRRVESAFGLPVRLHEIGCSAGLSLRFDALVNQGVVTADKGEWGEMPTIIDRVGCDLSPVDASSTQGRLLLTSYIWPDHLDRYERLRSALEIAHQVDASLVSSDALDHVRALELRQGSTLVVWHSAMWPYLTPEQRADIRSALEDLGRGATPGRPLVHISLEPISQAREAQHRFTLTMTTWPGVDGLPAGTEVPWGTTPPAGMPVDWSVACAGGIVRDARGRILMVRRGQEPARGQWSIPGGRVHDGESWDVAAVREVEEETGIAASGPSFVGIVERGGAGGPTYVIADFLMTGQGEPEAGDDADDARWVDVADLSVLDTAPGLLDALRSWQVLG